MKEISQNQSTDKQTVLFLCTYNSVRSHITEGLMRTLYPDRFEVYSAGIAPAGIHPLAIMAMEKIGIDIKNQQSKSVREFRDWQFDYVVTFRSEVRDTLGINTPKARVYLNRPVKSPLYIYEDDDAVLKDFRNLRDKLQAILIDTFGEALTDKRVMSTGGMLSHDPDP